MPSHVHHQHVLRFERFLVSGTILPLTHERFFVRLYVVVDYVLDQHGLSLEFQIAVLPMTVGLDEIRFPFEFTNGLRGVLFQIFGQQLLLGRLFRTRFRFRPFVLRFARVVGQRLEQYVWCCYTRFYV